MTQYKYRLLSLIIRSALGLLFASNLCQATDIAQGVREGSGTPNRGDGGYFELGASGYYFHTPWVNDDEDSDQYGLGIAIGGAYSYKGFFVEAAQGTYDGINLGYNFLNTQNWSFDFLASSFYGSIYKEEDPQEGSNDPDRDLMYRDTFYNGAGFRATGYWGNTIFQYRLVTDIHDDNGITSSARIGQSWQLRNWNFHAILSSDYHSQEANQYWFGVSESEATERFPAYTPPEAFSFSAEIGVTYPIAEHWVWRSYVKYTGIPSSVSSSPVLQGDHTAQAITTINYVF